MLILASVSVAGVFGAKGDDVAQKQVAVRADRDEMLAELYDGRPELRDRLPKAAGYATFSMKDVNVVLLETAHGHGLLIDNATGKETFMRVASLGGGIGMGVKDIRVVFIFRDAEVMHQFVEQGWQFGASADASAKYEDTGVAAEQDVKSVVDVDGAKATTAVSTDVRAGLVGEGDGAAGVGVGGGMEIYQFTASGISLQATVAGTKYWKDSKLNP
jgi:lipid-binding SYLF domain-containing protein